MFLVLFFFFCENIRKIDQEELVENLPQVWFKRYFILTPIDEQHKYTNTGCMRI